ncbi:hypothetical protein [Sagittula sp. MA-2]|jgi:hypothetical protein|uniref:hypothetical protein n=1 Tax=Sagittula sp. MA-2 TaxID=3048007 RepID=UPI0024C37F8F|nr:hypothetical protein [Sagittula sp. MA-2]WHZ36512.1 hypothetical protein QNI11_05740 [Sagittula sp. MA-2]
MSTNSYPEAGAIMLPEISKGEYTDIETLSACPMGTVFWHEYFEFDDESEKCILISAGDATDEDMFRVRYLDLDGNTRTMWVNDDDSGFFVEWRPTRPLSIKEIDGLLAAKVYWIGGAA